MEKSPQTAEMFSGSVPDPASTEEISRDIALTCENEGFSGQR
jgi:hypothetical protein